MSKKETVHLSTIDRKLLKIILSPNPCVPEQQLPNLKHMHWDVAKLLELDVDERFLLESNITPEQARDLVKGLLYLKERFDKNKE